MSSSVPTLAELKPRGLTMTFILFADRDFAAGKDTLLVLLFLSEVRYLSSFVQVNSCPNHHGQFSTSTRAHAASSLTVSWRGSEVS